IAFLHGLDQVLNDSGHDMTIVHTSEDYELASLSKKELVNLLGPEELKKVIDIDLFNDILKTLGDKTLGKLGYIRKELLYMVLLAIKSPVRIPDGAEDYVNSSIDQFRVT